MGGKQDVHPASGKQDVDIDVTARAQGGQKRVLRGGRWIELRCVNKISNDNRRRMYKKVAGTRHQTIIKE